MDDMLEFIRNAKPGDPVQYQDKITDEIIDTTVVFIENDIEYKDLYYIYLKADKEKLNDKYDNRFGNYYCIVTGSI